VKPAGSAAGWVAIVSTNSETLDGLKAYLERAGIASRGARGIRDVTKIAPANATAVVLFPDDYADKSVIDLLESLRRQRPRLLVVLVTRDPSRFRSSVDDERALAPIVLPKPPFGWEIVDAIRAHAARGASS
jgi:DNA-binding NtrC family response regulator